MREISKPCYLEQFIVRLTRPNLYRLAALVDAELDRRRLTDTLSNIEVEEIKAVRR